MKGHRLHARRKIVEMEENRGLIDKKAYEDQLARLDQFSFGSLSLFSLSLTLGHLEFSWRTLALDLERQITQDKGRSK